jgi:hypothetical protein
VRITGGCKPSGAFAGYTLYVILSWWAEKVQHLSRFYDFNTVLNIARDRI